MSGTSRFGQGATSPDGSTGSEVTGGITAKLFQSGIATTSSGAATIVFPVAFNAPPVVVASANTSADDVAAATTITATGFVLDIYLGSTAGLAGTVTASWMAHGF